MGGTAVRELQERLVSLGSWIQLDELQTQAFGHSTATALWRACKSGALKASDPIVLAARAEVCTPMAIGSGQPVPGASMLLNGVWVPLPEDLPLWVVPYRMGQLKSVRRRNSIKQIILHHDAGASAVRTWGVLLQRKNSSHGCTDDNGIGRQFLDCIRRVAWHAMGHVRLPGGSVVEHGFNFQSMGWDISNPVIQDTAAGRADADRPLETERVHGRVMTHLDCYPCQEESTLAIVKFLRQCAPTIGPEFRAEAEWKGDLTGDSSGTYGHYHVSREKIDPFGFPMSRLAELKDLNARPA